MKFNGEGNEVVNYKGQKFENKDYDPARAQSRNSLHPLTNYLQVQAYPTMVFLDEKKRFDNRAYWLYVTYPIRTLLENV